MIDQELNELSCKIFLEADLERKDLAQLLSEEVTLDVSSGPTSSVIRNEIGELELRRNDDRNEVAARAYPDGFLHFCFVLELYARPTARHEDEVSYVATLLNRLWSSGFPAVASCDYENELPRHGGYRDASLPWPSSTFNGISQPSSYARDLGDR